MSSSASAAAIFCSVEICGWEPKPRKDIVVGVCGVVEIERGGIIAGCVEKSQSWPASSSTVVL